jgi:hypothetical protein
VTVKAEWLVIVQSSIWGRCSFSAPQEAIGAVHAGKGTPERRPFESRNLIHSGHERMQLRCCFETVPAIHVGDVVIKVLFRQSVLRTQAVACKHVAGLVKTLAQNIVYTCAALIGLRMCLWRPASTNRISETIRVAIQYSSKLTCAKSQTDLNGKVDTPPFFDR